MRLVIDYAPAASEPTKSIWVQDGGCKLIKRANSPLVCLESAGFWIDIEPLSHTKQACWCLIRPKVEWLVDISQVTMPLEQSDSEQGCRREAECPHETTAALVGHWSVF